MSRIGLGILFMMFSRLLFASENSVDRIYVGFESNVESKSDLIPIRIVINNNESGTAWLDVNTKYKIIFSNKTYTTTDLAEALSTLAPARSLRFTCENSPAKFCANYKQFEFSYDFDTGTLSLFYEVNKALSGFIKSEAALSLYQTLLISESAADNKYRSGQWSGQMSSGLSNNTLLNASISYDIEDSAFVFDKVDWTYEGNASTQYKIYYNNKISSMLNRLDADNLKGVELLIGKDSDNFDTVISPVMVDVKNDGIINIYDQYNTLVGTTSVLQGLNRINLPSDIIGNSVRLDLIVHGDVRESFELPILKRGYNGNTTQVDAGFADVMEEDALTMKNKQHFYVSMNHNFPTIKTGFFAIPDMDRYAASVSFTGFTNANMGIESTYIDSDIQHDLTGSLSFSVLRNDIFINGSKSISQTPKETFSAGLSRSLWRNARLELYYNQSSYSYNYTKSVKEPKHHQRNKMYKMLSTRLSSRYETSLGLFDFSITAGTSFSSDNRIGFSISYQPKVFSKLIRPSVGFQFDRDMSHSYISNELSVSENLTLTPEVRYSNMELSQYGAVASYNNKFINSDYSYFKSPFGYDMHINASSHSFISSRAVHISSSSRNLALQFNNLVGDDAGNNASVLNINGEEKIINDDEVIYDDHIKSEQVEIYSASRNVILDEKYFGMNLKPHRLYHINYKHESENKLVYGRVLSGDNPVPNAVIETSSTTSKTDANGYFSIGLTSLDTILMIKSDDVVCFSSDIDSLNIKKTNDGYIGRLQCII